MKGKYKMHIECDSELKNADMDLPTHDFEINNLNIFVNNSLINEINLEADCDANDLVLTIALVYSINRGAKILNESAGSRYRKVLKLLEHYTFNEDLQTQNKSITI